MINDPSQQEIDTNWESLKQAYADKGFSEQEFLKVQLASALFIDLPTELRQAKRREHGIEG